MADTLSRPAASFTSEAIASINRAYAEAVDIIGAEEPRDELRGRLAEHMILLARNGETDEARLCSLSVIAVLGRAPSRQPGRVARGSAAGWR